MEFVVGSGATVMLVFVVIGLIWVVVTVIGHASWLVMSAILRSVFGAVESETSVPSLELDIVASHRVLSLMSSQGLLAPREIRFRRQEIDGLRARVWKAGQVKADATVGVGQNETENEVRNHVQAPPLAPKVEPPKTQPQTVERKQIQPRPVPVVETMQPKATVSPSFDARKDIDSSGQPKTVPSEPVEPRVSLGESMAAFLADHNIRWGELLAGALIVVCSIGLVISLWETLSQAHRVIPSLVFMTGNAAIFGAGLYTFFRWRLPDTSRAMLLIAMLLVPLGILAGLSTGGIGTTAVLLNDPITVGAILLAGSVYIWMLWHASRALVGSHCALAMTLGVVGPVAVLPVVPAAIRAWGGAAGMVIAFASVSVWLTQWLTLRKRGRRIRAMGMEPFVRKRALVNSVSLFAFSVSVGYIAYMLREFDASWMTMSMAALPGMVAFSAAAGSISESRRHAKIAFAGAVSSIGLGLFVCVLMIPSLISMQWLFSWGIGFTASALLAAWVYRSPRWTLCAAAPLGIATVLSSPSFYGLILWEDVPVWRRVIGGEPMLAALSMGGIALTLRLLIRDDQHRRSISIAAAGWMSYGICNAVLLSIAPTALMGALTFWSLPFALGLATLFVVFESMQGEAGNVNESKKSVAFAVVANALSFAFWLSALKPVVLGAGFPGLRPMTLTFAATGLSVMLFAELLQNRLAFAKGYRVGSAVFLSLAALLSIPLSGSSVFVAVLILLAATASLWWIAIRLDGVFAMGLSRLTAFVATIVIGHQVFGETLTAVDAWRSGIAVWGWAAAFLCLAMFARTQDALADWFQSSGSTKNVLGTHSITHVWQRYAIVGIAFWASAILAGLGALLSFGSLVVSVLARLPAERWAWSITVETTLPICVLLGLGFAVLLRNQKRVMHDGSEALVDRFSGYFVALSALLWCSWQIGVRWFTECNSQLVVATSVAAAGCFAIALMHRGVRSRPGREPVDRLDSTSRVAFRGEMSWAGLLIVTVSSATLMTGGWFPDVINGIAPKAFVTWAIAMWWAAAALTSVWLGIRERSALHFNVTALIGPAIVVLTTPLWFPGQYWIWLQHSALIALAAWFAIELLLSRGKAIGLLRRPIDKTLVAASEPSRNGLLVFGLWCGLSTCVAVLVGLLADIDVLLRLHQPIGVTLSIASVTALLFVVGNGNRGVESWPRCLPIGLSLLSGHASLIMFPFASKIASELDWGVLDAQRILGLLWTLVAAISLVLYWGCSIKDRESERLNLWHAGLLVVAVSFRAMFMGDAASEFAMGLVATCLGVFLVVARTVVSAWDSASRPTVSRRSVITSKCFSWFCLGMGVWAFIQIGGVQFSLMNHWTMVLAWCGGVTVIWRVVAPGVGTAKEGRVAHWRRLADSEGAVLVLLSLMGETLLLWLFPSEIAEFGLWEDPFFWCRIGIGVLVAVSTVFRVRRVGMLEVGLLTGLGSVTLFAMRLATEYWTVATVLVPEHVAMVACLVSAMGFAILVFRSADICSLIRGIRNRWHGLMPVASQTFLPIRELNHVLVRVSSVPIVASLAVCTWLLVCSNGIGITAVAICSVAMLAISMGELGEQSGLVRLRDASMTLGLTAMAMWASLNVIGHRLPLLSLSTRWFVAWVVVAASLAVGTPKWFSKSAMERWQPTIRRGVVMAISLAIGSLVSTLLQEAWVRTSGDTNQLNHQLVVGMAAVLAMLSAVCTFAGMVSGPGFSYRKIWGLSDRQRSGFIVAAQVLGGLTWFHLFLCKNPMASLGLRAYWPYVVMVLAFTSTGITEWARRRGDDVLQRTLRQTAFYLPLIPVIGFWLSGSLVTSFFGETAGNSWGFINGKVTYQALLVTAAIYYGVISFLWNSGRTRVMSIVIGNMALWVVLMQTPGWSFLGHPQAWLVPPVVCALVATHFCRDALGRDSATAIRYASTLVIYITSTADMLIQGVGATLAGPIVLIVLALIGVAAGIALRVRPFLYLGTTFVMIGLLSMVWHAQQQIDAVWPWWVFGITTGVLLLAGLMGIEKNKPKLKSVAASMSSWG